MVAAAVGYVTKPLQPPVPGEETLRAGGQIPLARPADGKAWINPSFIQSRYLHDLNGRRQRDKDVQLVNALSRIRLHTKLALLLGLFTLGLVASIAAGTSIMQQRMVDDRVNKLRAVVQSAIGIAKIVDLEAGAAGLTREQAIDRLRATIRGMRFDDGAGYIIVRRGEPLFCCTEPTLEWRASPRRPLTRVAGR